MSGNMYVSMKTYYFGVFSTIATLILVAVTEPEFFYFWKIGTPEYVMSQAEFLGCLTIGFFSWSSQDTMTAALSYMKSGTVAGFYNVAMLLSFATDIYYFGQPLLTNDIVGVLMIILSTSAQGYILNKQQEEKERLAQLDMDNTEDIKGNIGDDQEVQKENGAEKK